MNTIRLLAVALALLAPAACGRSGDPVVPKQKSLMCPFNADALAAAPAGVKARAVWSSAHSGEVDPLMQRFEELQGLRVVTPADKYHGGWTASRPEDGQLRLRPPGVPLPEGASPHPESWEVVMSNGALLKVTPGEGKCTTSLLRPGGVLKISPHPEQGPNTVQLTGCWLTGGPHVVKKPLTLKIPAGKCSINALRTGLDPEGRPAHHADPFPVEIAPAPAITELVMPLPTAATESAPATPTEGSPAPATEGTPAVPNEGAPGPSDPAPAPIPG